MAEIVQEKSQPLDEFARLIAQLDQLRQQLAEGNLASNAYRANNANGTLRDLPVSDFWEKNGLTFSEQVADSSVLDPILTPDNGLLLVIPMYKEDPEAVNLVLRRIREANFKPEHNIKILFLTNGYNIDDPIDNENLDYLKRIFKENGRNVVNVTNKNGGVANELSARLHNPDGPQGRLLENDEHIMAIAPQADGDMNSIEYFGTTLLIDTKKGGLGRAEVIAAETAKAFGISYLLKTDCDLFIRGQDFVDFIASSMKVFAEDVNKKLKIIIGENTLVGEAGGEPIKLEDGKKLGGTTIQIRTPWYIKPFINNTVIPEEVLPLVLGKQEIYGGTYMARVSFIAGESLGHRNTATKEESLFRQALLGYFCWGDYKLSNMPVYVCRDTHDSALGRILRNFNAERQAIEAIKSQSFNALREIFPSMVKDKDTIIQLKVKMKLKLTSDSSETTLPVGTTLSIPANSAFTIVNNKGNPLPSGTTIILPSGGQTQLIDDNALLKAPYIRDRNFSSSVVLSGPRVTIRDALTKDTWEKHIDKSLNRFYDNELNRLYSQSPFTRFYRYSLNTLKTARDECYDCIRAKLNKEKKVTSESYYKKAHYEGLNIGEIYRAFKSGVQRGVTNAYFIESFLQSTREWQLDNAEQLYGDKKDLYDQGSRPKAIK